MKLKELAVIRTGLVVARKRATVTTKITTPYKIISLKCINDSGNIEINNTESFNSVEELQKEYISQMGDIIVRLSSPYTSVIIDRQELSGYVIPSHFAIIRCDTSKVNAKYVYWLLQQNDTMRQIFQNNSGSTAFGTISSGFFAELEIKQIPIKKQEALGELAVLSKRETELLENLIEYKKKYNNLLTNKILINIDKEKKR